MRILYIDIDCLRPDHLGCYGYHRYTSPNLDRLAAEGVRFDNCYISDAPCLPSRTALFCGRAGIHNGVTTHGGVASEPFPDGIRRGFHAGLDRSSWIGAFRRAGYYTASISPFAERHSAWWWSANFNEQINTGKRGDEIATEMEPVALEWLGRQGEKDNWFLHLNLWDPHTPYRTPADWGNPFEDQPLPAWLTEEIRVEHWTRPGPHSAREVNGFSVGDAHRAASTRNVHQPFEMSDMAEVRRMFDGYDCGVRYADETIGRVLHKLDELGVLEDTAIIVSADHGENLGELGIYADHQTADNCTSRVPLIIRWPGVTDALAGRDFNALHWHLDFAATALELAGATVPPNWDGQSFAPELRQGLDAGRETLVLSQMAWTCQRSVRFDDWLCIRTYHDGFHGFPDLMLFDVRHDPHQIHDLAAQHPDIVNRALCLLDEWMADAMRTASHGQDPLWTVMQEGGPFHTRGQAPKYLQRLRETGRAAWADHFEKIHPRECGS